MTLFKKMVDGEEKLFKRTHHRWIHPTKGWRQFAKPRGTNKRRKLIPTGTFKGTHEYNRQHQSGGRWPKLTAAFKRLLAHRRRRHAA